jgi:hypothetical protein
MQRHNTDNYVLGFMFTNRNTQFFFVSRGRIFMIAIPLCYHDIMLMII